MDKNLVRWNLIAGKIEAIWLILFGIVSVGYVRSGELDLFLSGGWIKFIGVFGVLMIVGGVAVLLFCRDNEKDNVTYLLAESGRGELTRRFIGIGLLALVLACSLIVPYFTVLKDPYIAGTEGWAVLAAAEESVYAESRRTDPGTRDFRDWMILFAKSADLSKYEGEAAKVTGEALVDKRLPEGYFFLRRKIATHCVDCAEYYSITCRVGEGDEVPASGAWIEANGEFVRGKVGKQNVLVLDVDNFDTEIELSDPLLYL